MNADEREWDDCLPGRQVDPETEHRETVEAIRQAVKDMEAGLARPIEEVDAEIRKELGFPPRTARREVGS